MSYLSVSKAQMRVLTSIVDNTTYGARNPLNHNARTIAALVRKGLVGFTRYGIVPTIKGALIVKNRRTS